MANKTEGFWGDLLLEEFVESLEWARSPLPLIIPPPERLAGLAADMLPAGLKQRDGAYLTMPVPRQQPAGG
ncbi:MAG: hypothetical protein PW843_03370 [Azospirillaceae bacterium]|nr:hypothetical protein [Azospirillaceae bacterium]